MKFELLVLKHGIKTIFTISKLNEKIIKIKESTSTEIYLSWLLFMTIPISYFILSFFLLKP